MYESGEAEIEAIARVIRSGRLFRYNTGPNGEESETLRLEKEIAQLVGCSHSIAVTSGTAALICALVGMGVGPEDEVIVPGYTFMATALAALAVGATPVLAEVDTGLMLDAADVEKKITRRTKVIIPVHMMGHVVDLEPILALARRHKIKVLEDCCQCVGGSYRGLRVGRQGDAGAFSFNYFKNISAGEGGAVMSSDRTIADRARIYHDSGITFRSELKDSAVQSFAGINYRMEEIRAAMLRVQLGRLDGILTALRRRYHQLRDQLLAMPEFKLSPVHDLDGVCGSALFLRTNSRDESLAFAKAAADRKLPVMLPLDSGKHVYSNWEPLMERRAAHHPALDPLHATQAGREQKYTKDMLPQTLEHLARTVCVMIPHRAGEQEIEKLARALQECALIASGARAELVGTP
jgi:dTDP-4-amino-4,6-dideoxygalactose transaminase